ncbi:MAG TPA: thiamine phosphate synthase [Elusimicrobia bacterium]|nr:MAG: thiamine-phosphate diphosphorylase [Elusimicrobia bacterium RIFOXYA12_FULL_49_49]OGS09866.1 MAG: thiamine-phosphate diphosphorylase [Elusimicrobia bacterium RIFOXYA1_FULL_47_7]OGS10646.1 MAG: thiamine-phosphate diphosphorylase [Elusimicrobia bacterium RIFOXYB1_FULL_48_9]OGS15071.1 MAG: thiamine-phosphate diphosphorylase [Elusimicrobia bacterium RIFOXYA2_FULL_47_53]OGS29409.1 MAG: thiamine-phosphate diphosphorylase [Elusimicrobia bacterium RIFOXYB2_FULL_46_23]HBU69227.1 thiamine phospha
MKGYYFITDSGLSKAGILKDAAVAAECGAAAVQYRNKSADTGSLYTEALELRKLCGNIPLIINDRIDIALAVKADGVHIGQSDMPFEKAREILGKGRIIGLTVHSEAEAVLAEKLGADYIGLSPIFSTATKPDAGKPAGAELIRKVKNLVKVPVVAIGGINLTNAREVVEAGADALCAISAVVAADDPAAEIRKFQKLFV